MEEGELGPPSQEEACEEAALHYEERISALLVTIVRLQGKMERLQQDRAREEEEEEEEGMFFSDLGSESTASLPRCSYPLAKHPRIPPAQPPAAPGEGKADLFLDVHKALTSLENVLLSHRKHLPSTGAELQGCTQLAQGLEARLVVALQRDVSGCPPQEAEGPPCERMAALYKERNAALRAQLEARQELLGRSKATLAAQQQQRDSLQGQVRELQESLSRAETCFGGAPRPLWEGAQDPHSGASQNGLHPPWGATGAQPAPTLPPSPPAELQSSLEQLHRRLEGLRGLNCRLSGALQESKADAEQLSLLLGQQESHQTGLALALHGSERCLEAYETLWALTATDQMPSAERGAEAPWAGASKDPNAALEEASWILQACSRAHRSSWDQEGVPDSSLQLTGSEVEAKQGLRECIGHLRAEQRSLKLPAHPPPLGLGTVASRLSAGIAAKVTEGRRALEEALPSLATPPWMPKSQLLQELHSTREALADLGTRLHLTARAKQGLALCTHTLPAQEAACMLLIQTLQREHRDLLRGQPDLSSPESSSSSEEEDSGAWVPDRAPYWPLPAAPNTAEGSLDRRKPEALTLSVLETLARIRALKERLEGLWVALEEKSQDCRAHEAQELELMQDFFQAHSALLLAYQKAHQKQESQVGQLETQVELMTRRQAKQRQALLQTLQQLQQPPGAPPGLPQALGPSGSPLEPPGNLRVPSSFWSSK